MIDSQWLTWVRNNRNIRTSRKMKLWVNVLNYIWNLKNSDRRPKVFKLAGRKSFWIGSLSNFLKNTIWKSRHRTNYSYPLMQSLCLNHSRLTCLKLTWSCQTSTAWSPKSEELMRPLFPSRASPAQKRKIIKLIWLIAVPPIYSSRSISISWNTCMELFWAVNLTCSKVTIFSNNLGTTTGRKAKADSTH